MKSGSPADREKVGSASYCSMSIAELETIAVNAIREHRKLLAADQEVYEEWLRASEDPTTSVQILQTLQNEHMVRQERSQAQQCELARILEALGFVPTLPEDSGSDLN
ncbi:transcriptional repressor TraM [Shinella sp. CPCC 100929]|uniref:Transcriptional repressor TraM n=1 Tax=Shinella lacus TaxID=2654216 RepID=A0ABT1RC32_9HYPH|nr:transcriptional repressor TraM [Shinella lacus]MCQ4632682.1 transcriptional repressor TraM [Shinella lacus]